MALSFGEAAVYWWTAYRRLQCKSGMTQKAADDAGARAQTSRNVFSYNPQEPLQKINVQEMQHINALSGPLTHLAASK